MDHPIHEVADFGVLIRNRRKVQGYTQARLAALCGTGVRFISDLENGKETVEFGKAFVVAQNLGIDLVARVRGGEE
ncbi:MAG TPA: transcriptional regulator [Treponema sp.]|nr:transcriptional regulator [Treponema sp.]